MLSEVKIAQSPEPHRVNSPIRREAFYFGDASKPLFGCYHTADVASARDCVAVICNPIGYEYVHSHRSLRRLADNLALAGIPALRFDYDGTGDSPGTDLDPDRLGRWVQDIHTAMDHARTLSARTRVCLIGLRMGATLAAMAVAQSSVDWLVLWSPCVSGRRYMRELQAVAQLAAPRAAKAEEPLEVAGFLLSAQTQEQIRRIDLLVQAVRVSGRVLILSRNDLSEDHRLRGHFQSSGIATDALEFAGYADMMAEPHATLVPQAALEDIASWMVAQSLAYQGKPPCAPAVLTPAMKFPFVDFAGSTVHLTETACRFGEGAYLFGIHCQPHLDEHKRPTIVLFNAGSVHRVGPNRLYVDLARNLASLGFPSFRCDIEGIGDSVLRGSGRENHPYPDTADRDAQVVLHGLSQRFGVQNFVLMGLCSGAYTSFKAALSGEKWSISELVLINPLTFQWVEGDVLDTLHYREVAHYKGTMRRLESWKKLMRGQVNVIHLAKVVGSYCRKLVCSYLNAFAERWVPSVGPLLSRQLQSLFRQRRRVTLFIASGDPGWDMLSSGARLTARQALKDGQIALHFIEDADHTFTNESARMRLVRSLCAHFGTRSPLN